MAPFEDPQSLKWRSIHQTTARPEIVQAAFDTERGAGTDVAFEYFAVIADLFDDVVSLFFIKTEGFAIAGTDTQKTLNLGIFAGEHLIDVFGGNPQFFSLD